jgi:hypothetical protein
MIGQGKSEKGCQQKLNFAKFGIPEYPVMASLAEKNRRARQHQGGT